MKVHLLPKSRMPFIFDKIINIPIEGNAIDETLETILPRTPIEGGLIPVELKRMQKLKGYHLKRTVDANRIIQCLNYFKELGHPSYQDTFDSIEEYEYRCEIESQNRYELDGEAEKNESVHTTKTK